MLEFLKEEFARRCRTNPSYSLRSYAKQLDIHPSTLSAILRNKRKLSPKTAEHLAQSLELQEDGIKEALVYSTLKAPSPRTGRAYHTLDQAEFSMIRNWEHFAVLALLETSDPPTTLKEVASRLGLHPTLAGDTIHRLKSLGFLEEVPGQGWKVTEGQLTTPNGGPNPNIKENNRQYLEKALESLDRDPIDVRDITGITMAINPERLPQAKHIIQEFRRSLCELLEKGERSKVYRLNIQLFPLEKGEQQ